MRQRSLPTSLTVVTLLAAGLALAACSSDHERQPTGSRTFAQDVCLDEPLPAAAGEAAALVPATTCDDVVAAVRASALREMNETLDRNLREALALGCQPCVEWPSYGGGFGCGAAMSSGDYEAAGANQSADAGMAMAPAGDDEGSASAYSTTNNQEAEVDEPDFVKNDGAFIYIVANGKLHIIDAWPPETAHTLAAVPLEGTPTGLFVYGDRVVVYENLGPSQGYAQPDCTYAYDCQFEGKPGPWAISVYDITDPSHPVLARRVETDAALLSSRRVGAVVHTLVLSGETAQGQPYWQDWPSEIPREPRTCGDTSPRPGETEIRTAFARLRRENTALLAELTPTLAVPRLSDRRLVDGAIRADEQRLGSCAGWYVAPGGEGSRLLSLLSFDLTAADPIAATTVVGQAGAVYATTTSLYVAQSTGYRWAWYGYGGGHERTAVHKFRISGQSPATSYAGSGDVEGHVLNQFAMDEHEGRLRIATSVGWVPDPTVHSVLTVLAEDGGALHEIGRLDDIARGEDIRSVRFDDDVAYLVTFKKTDPLFVIDLADPQAPTVKSELKIPGFSTYMQLMDDTHVLGIGFDADDQGSFAWFQGIQLQVFDVADPYHPRVLHKEVIGTRGTTSEAATNHLAFNYFPPRDALALPMAICEGSSGGGDYADRMTFDGLLVYRVTVADGFTKLGGLPHSDPRATDANGWGCYNWWTTPSSGVKRSIFMDDYVWAIALDRVQVATLDALDRPLASIDLR